MMVKLNMSVEESIQQYKILSEEIFSEPRPLLKRLFGSDWSMYSGEKLKAAVESLLRSRRQPVALMMQSGLDGAEMTG
jgi:hypothetical protein